MRQRNEHAKRFGRWSCAKRLRRPARRGRILAPPDAGNISGRILKRSTRTDCKSVGYAFVGSNPTSPTERIKHGRLWRACFIRSVSEGGSAAPIRVRLAPHKACTASHPDRASRRGVIAEVVAARAGCGVESLRSDCVFFLNAWSRLAILLGARLARPNCGSECFDGGRAVGRDAGGCAL